MGAIAAIMGDAGDPGLSKALERMLARSPCRGAPQRHIEGSLALAVQALDWGDASLATVGNFTVAFHGVIGNWPELAPAHGLDFPDDASTATKLAIAFKHLGNALFVKLRGPFAIVIHDRRQDLVLAVRDTWAQRPLFFERKGSRTYLATEIRQVLAGSGSAVEIDGDVLIRNMLWQPVSPGKTHVRCIERVQANQVVHFAHSHSFEPVAVQETWAPPEEQTGPYHMEELAEELRSLIDQAVSRWLLGIPFALGLSGGVDSSTVWWTITQRLRAGDTRAALGRAISIALPGDPDDESDQIKRILAATGTQGTFVEYPPGNRVEEMLGNAEKVDSPVYQIFSDCPEFAKLVISDGRKLILSGFGGDLLLAGSSTYLLDLVRRLKLIAVLRDLLTFETATDQSRLGFIAGWVGARLRGRLTRWTGWRQREGYPGWIHQSRAAAVFAPVDGAQYGNTSQPMSRRRTGVLNMLAMRQNLAAQDGGEQFVASRGLANGSPLIDLDILDFALRTQPRAWTDGKRKKQLLRMVAYDRFPKPVQTWRNRSAWLIFEPAEIESLRQRLPPQSWTLVEERIVAAEAIERLFATATTNNQASSQLIEVASTEAVIRNLTCANR